jgi:hypothetical protein
MTNAWRDGAKETIEQYNYCLKRQEEHQRKANAYLGGMKLCEDSLRGLLENHEDPELEMLLASWSGES